MNKKILEIVGELETLAAILIIDGRDEMAAEVQVMATRLLWIYREYTRYSE